LTTREIEDSSEAPGVPRPAAQLAEDGRDARRSTVTVQAVQLFT